MFTKRLMQAAKVYSAIISPFFAPALAYLWLICFSYLRIFPWQYKLFVMLVLLAFTVVLPRIAIAAFRRMNQWTHSQLSHRERRYLPYVLTLCSYIACLLLLTQINVPVAFRSVLLASIVTIVICFVVNMRWKISTHMAGAGGLTGMLLAFSFLFYYNPLWPLCLFILLSGLLGTCRMVLRQHTLGQVIAGFLVGLTCALLSLLFLWVPGWH